LRISSSRSAERGWADAMTRKLVTTLVVKDLTLFFRNRFFAFITVLALVFYVLVYYLLPGSVDELLEIGFYAPDLPPLDHRAVGSGGRGDP